MNNEDKKVIRYLNRHPNVSVDMVKAVRNIKIDNNSPKLKKIYKLLNELGIDYKFENNFDFLQFLDDDIYIESVIKSQSDRFYILRNYFKIIRLGRLCRKFSIKTVDDFYKQKEIQI